MVVEGTGWCWGRGSGTGEGWLVLGQENWLVLRKGVWGDWLVLGSAVRYWERGTGWFWRGAVPGWGA